MSLCVFMLMKFHPTPALLHMPPTSFRFICGISLVPCQSNFHFKVAHLKKLLESISIPKGKMYIFPGGSVVKNPPANAGDTSDVGLISGSARSLGVGNGNPLQYSCLENLMDRGAWQATVHGVTKSQTWLSMHAYQVQLSKFRNLSRKLFWKKFPRVERTVTSTLTSSCSGIFFKVLNLLCFSFCIHKK